MSAERTTRRVAPRGSKIARSLSRALVLPLLLGAMPAAGQWNPQSPVPTFLDVRGVGMPTASHVLIATDDDSFDNGGALWESTDGGATWVQRDVPTSLADPLNGMFFLDALHGWTFGNANYRTTDGGTTWTALPFLGSTYFMEFETPDVGIATGNFGRQISLDGGASWSAAPDDIFALDFADATVGLGVAATGVYRTTDGGNTFTLVNAGDANDAAFLSAGVAVGIVDDTFVRSTDAGATWTPGASAEGRDRLVSVSGSTVLAWGRTGTFPAFDDRVFRSSDAGQTWTDLGPVLDRDAFSASPAFAVVDAQTVVVSNGNGDMLRSSNAGATWAQTFTSPGSQPSFLSSAVPAFADALHGVYGYGAGFVIRTTDGGATWAQVSSGTGESLLDVARFPNGDMIAVGENGTVLTSDGSAPWTLGARFATTHLQAVQVLGAQDVVVVDQAGRVYRSSNAGSTWNPGAAAPTGLTAHDLHFTTLLNGWVIGSGFSGAAVFHTTDGGNTWTPGATFQGLYVALDFEGSSGWALNAGGIFQSTTDDGATWTQGTLPSAPSVTDLEFFDVSIGYAVGWGGYAARSDDGGTTWQVLPTPNSTDQFTDIHLLGANELWVSTNNDRAYYSATGGQSWSVMPINSAGFGSFSAITAVPGGDAWTVGAQGFVEHFAGPPPPPVNRPPDASFTFHTTGLTVDFTDASADPDGIIVAWEWDFGDGATSTLQSPSHTFASANTYIVRLTVTDDDADTGSAVRFVVVQPGPGGTFGEFTEVTPLDPLFVTPQDEDFWVSTTAPADYDGDGDLDVAVLGYYVVYFGSVTERLVLLRNDGPAAADEWDFSYIDVPLGDLTSGASDLAWGDVDGDGDQDLAVGTDGATVIYRNDAGTLVATDTALPGYLEDNDQADFDLHAISWADFDNDGDLDLLLPSVLDDVTFEFRTALMRNDGPNGTGGFTFTETDSVFAPTSNAQSAWADFDGDADLDLFLVNLAPLTGEGFIRRYRNDGAGVFVGEDILGTLTVEHGEAQWGDYDADGDLDILVAGNIQEDGLYSNALRIYRNDAGTFVALDVIDCIPCEGWFDLTAATWADYDSDGDVDILLAGTYNSGSQIEGRAKVYDNNGGVFTDSGNQLPAPRASGTRGGTFSWLDLDGEGDLDYFIAGEYFVPGGNGLIEAQMHAYRNDAQGQNAPPTAPAGLAADVQGAAGTVLLSWNPATDDLTAAPALTYDLELYRNGVPVGNPRRVPEPGSISAVTQWSLAGLPDGAYTWTVRAVDSAYNGGPVAQGTFALGATGVETLAAVPRTYEFAQNRPNPFRTTTTFRFALPERASVNLAVYDVAGRLVTRLVDEARVPGIYDVTWNARGIASGTYFVRLSTGSFTKTHRVLLLK